MAPSFRFCSLWKQFLCFCSRRQLLAMSVFFLALPTRKGPWVTNKASQRAKCLWVTRGADGGKAPNVWMNLLAGQSLDRRHLPLAFSCSFTACTASVSLPPRRPVDRDPVILGPSYSLSESHSGTRVQPRRRSAPLRVQSWRFSCWPRLPRWPSPCSLASSGWNASGCWWMLKHWKGLVFDG